MNIKHLMGLMTAQLDYLTNYLVPLACLWNYKNGM